MTAPKHAKRPYVRTRADERAALAAESTEELALRIVEIGESLQRNEVRMEKERQRTHRSQIGSASLEAHHLAHTRAALLAIAAEIDHRVLALCSAEVFVEWEHADPGLRLRSIDVHMKIGTHPGTRFCRTGTGGEPRIGQIVSVIEHEDGRMERVRITARHDMGANYPPLFLAERM